MAKLVLLFVIAFSICKFSFSQLNKEKENQQTERNELVVDLLILRNYNYSPFLSIEERSFSKKVLGVYGNLLGNNPTIKNSRYLYQSQEWDDQLGIYLLPERIYSPKEKRFYQPDPASQYFSSYCFVGADPVNVIDIDGAAGKPIILYSYESREPSKKIVSALAEDMSKHVPGHYIPMVDFSVGRYPVPSDWNGAIFIEANSSELGDIYAERYSAGKGGLAAEEFRSPRENISRITKTASGERMAAISNSRLGEAISDLSEKTGVPLSSVTFSGCEGDAAAQKLGNEIVNSSKKIGLKQQFETFGLKKGYQANFLSLQKAKDLAELRRGNVGLCNLLPLHYFVGKSGNPNDYRFDDRGGTFGVYDRATNEQLDVVRGPEFEGMANGRVPYPTSNFFEPRLFVAE